MFCQSTSSDGGTDCPLGSPASAATVFVYQLHLHGLSLALRAEKSRGKWGKGGPPGQSEPPTLIHLPELPSSFRDSHFLRVTLLHVLNVMTRRYD